VTGCIIGIGTHLIQQISMSINGMPAGYHAERFVCFVAFTNANSASQPNSHDFSYLNPAAAPCLRIKFNKISGTNICLDYGISKGYSDLNIALRQAF